MSATPWPAQKLKKKTQTSRNTEILTCLVNFSTPSSWTRSQSKTKSVEHAIIQHTLTIFTKDSMNCATTCPKVWRNGSQQLKILKHWSFLINLGTPPCRPRSQSKIEINEHATACDTLIISCNFNISHFFACPKTWPRQQKYLKAIILHALDHCSMPT